MKTIESKDLVIGQEYYDSEDLQNATLLRFVGHDKECNTLDFEYVSGPRTYLEHKGVIPLGVYQEFYQP